MCGRYTNQATWAEYHATLRGFLDGHRQGWKAPDEEPKPRYNLAPTQKAPIIIADGDTGLEGVMARWDLVPFFHKGPLESKKWSSINARVETITSSGAFRDSVKRRRCLVPNHGFFEWGKEGEGKKQVKTPFWIKPSDTEIAFFAGVWDRWKGIAKGEEVEFISFAILTCEPNSLVAPLHDRMPVILRPEDYQTWVFGEAETALKVAGPYPAQVMTAVQLGPAVNSSRNEGPELLVAVA